MKIITANPVVTKASIGRTNTNVASGDEFYSNFPGGAFANPNSKLFQDAQNFNKSQNEKGLTWDKVKGAWTKAQDSGLVDKAKGLLGGLFGGGNAPSGGGSAPVSKTPPTKSKKMTTTTKVLIGVGVVVAGFLIYKVASNKSN